MSQYVELTYILSYFEIFQQTAFNEISLYDLYSKTFADPKSVKMSYCPAMGNRKFLSVSVFFKIYTISVAVLQLKLISLMS